VTDAKKENALSRYIRETAGELRKVAWPTRREALQLTAIVLTVMIVMGIYLAIVDGIAGALMKLVLGA